MAGHTQLSLFDTPSTAPAEEQPRNQDAVTGSTLITVGYVSEQMLTNASKPHSSQPTYTMFGGAVVQPGQCKHLIPSQEIEGSPGTCTLATELSNNHAGPVPSTHEACKACSQTIGPSVKSIIVRHLHSKGMLTKKFIDDNRWIITTGEPTTEGPGTELHRLLSWFVSPEEGCKCTNRAAIMNEWGIDGCKRNIEVIVDWLVEEARRRHYPYLRTVLHAVVQMAINNARRKLRCQLRHQPRPSN